MPHSKWIRTPKHSMANRVVILRRADLVISCLLTSDFLHLSLALCMDLAFLRQDVLVFYNMLYLN